MKTSLLIPACALLGAAAFAADPTPPASTRAPNPPAAVSGKATITIDVNGKKETREVDLGNTLQFIGTTTINSAPAKSSAAPHAWLGVVTEQPSDDLRAQLPIADGTGLLVRSVIADSPAAKGGLEQNDVLVRLDDQILTNADQLGALIRTKKEGGAVRVTYLRKGVEAFVDVKLGARTDETALGDVSDGSNLGALIGKSVTGAIQGALKPLVLAGTLMLNKDGQTLSLVRLPDGDKSGAAVGQEIAGGVLTWENPADGDKAPPKADGQFSLFSGNVQVDVTAQMKQLEKTLRDAGLNNAAIVQTENAVAAAVAQVQKALANAAADKGDIQRSLEKAKDQVNRAVEQALRAEAEAALKAKLAEPTAPAPAPQKAP